MRYPVEIPGCTATVELEAGGFETGPKLFVNDAPARQGHKKGEFLLPGDNGEEIVVRFKSQFLDPIPVLEADGQSIRVVPPLTWEWGVIGLPLILMVFGGCIGGLIGGAGASAVAVLMRSSLPTGVRVVLSLLLSVVIVGGGFIALEMIRGTVGGSSN